MKNFVLCLGFIFVACTNINNKKDYNFIKGLNAYENGNKVEALKEYKIAYSKGIRKPYLLKEMAYVYIEFGDLEKARNLYIEILEKEPENEEVLHNLLEIFYEIKDIKNIEKYSKNILNKNSDLYIKSQFNLAYIKNDYNLAREILENMFLIKRNDTLGISCNKYFLNQIKTIYKNRENDKLLEILEILYNNNKDKQDLIGYYSSVLVEKNQFNKAEEILMKEVLERDDIGDILVDLADVYHQNNEQEKLKNIMKILENQSITYNMNKYILLKNKIK